MSSGINGAARILAAVLLLCGSTAAASGQEAAASGQEAPVTAEAPMTAETPVDAGSPSLAVSPVNTTNAPGVGKTHDTARHTDAGIIFNMSSPLNGLESYQGGLGAKLSFYPSAVRAGVNLQYASTSNSFSLTLGAVYEYHLLPAPLSPYVGVSAGLGYVSQQPTATLFPVSVGAVMGIEMHVLDNLSIFAEYSVSLAFTVITDLQSQATSTSVSLGTGMGNLGMLGVVVYFPLPVPLKE
jgi:hypothetical protein